MADAAVILLYGLKTNVYADPRTAPAGGVDRTPPGFEGSPSNIRINPYTFTINLAAKSLHPHLPYIVRFTILTLVFVPSTNPFDKGDDTAFSIASRSFFILSVNFLISWIAQVLYLSMKEYSNA